MPPAPSLPALTEKDVAAIAIGIAGAAVYHGSPQAGPKAQPPDAHKPEALTTECPNP